MGTLIHKWLEVRRYRATVQLLSSLSPGELQALWIAPAEIERLAHEASRRAAEGGRVKSNLHALPGGREVEFSASYSRTRIRQGGNLALEHVSCRSLMPPSPSSGRGTRSRFKLDLGLPE